MNVNPNVGGADRLVRAILGVVLLALVLLGVVGGILAIGAVVFGAVMLLTATTRFCPLYLPLRFSTAGKRRRA
jgi:hypothetical protein